jgi:hypothetical protein
MMMMMIMMMIGKKEGGVQLWELARETRWKEEVKG